MRTERGMLAAFLAGVLAVSAALLVLFGAWGRLTEPQRPEGVEPVLFTGWGGLVETQVFADLVREFERRNPDVPVEYRPVPRDYVTKLKLMFAGGTPPDLFYVPDGVFPGFAVAGQLENLQPYLEREEGLGEDDFWPASLTRYRFDGRRFGSGPLYALPKDLGPTVMYVNQEMVRRAGLESPVGRAPLTWDEALAFWRALTSDEDGDGRIDQWGVHGMPLEAVVWSNGGDFLDETGRRFTMAEDERALEAAEWLVALQTEHRVAPMERHRQSIPVDTLFLTGRLATFIGGRWMVPLFRKAGFEWDVAPIPVSPKTRREAGWSGSVGLAIGPGSPRKEGAWRLLEFLVGPDGQAVQALTGFQLPNQRSLATSDLFLQPDQPPRYAELFLRAAAHQRSVPPTRTPDTEWWDMLHRHLGAAYRGERSATAVVRQSAPEIQAALDRGWRGLDP